MIKQFHLSCSIWSVKVCDALTIGIVSAVGTAAQAVSTNISAQASANAANEAAKTQYQQLQYQREQADQKAQQDIYLRRQKANEELARMRVAFAEAGVSGNSPLHELASTMLSENQDVGIIESNRENVAQQINAEAQGVYAQADSRIAQASAAITNPLMMGLQIGTAGYSAYTRQKYIDKLSASSTTMPTNTMLSGG